MKIFISILVLLLYFSYCAYLHKKEKIVFFYSYRDMAVTILIPIILGTLIFLVTSDIIVQSTAISIGVCSSIILLLMISLITYRANHRRVFLTLFVVISKILLGIFLLFLSILLFVFAMRGRDREKYERQKTYKKRTTTQRVSELSIGAAMILWIISCCCKYTDLSMPQKI